jgi:hypothetical protein
MRNNCLSFCGCRSCDVNLSPILTRRLVRLTGSCLALLALHFLAQSTARASCGDYLVHTPSTSTPFAHAMDGASRTPASLPHNKLPCSGPNCSSRSEQMPLAPVTTPTQIGEQWGWFTSPRLMQAPSVSFLVLPSIPVPAIDLCAPLERPPRISANFAASL